MRWLFREKKKPEEPLLLWGIIEGPFHRSEVEDAEDQEFEWMMLMKVSKGDEVKHSQVWFADYNQVYSMKKYFDKNMEPLVMGVSND